MKIIYILRTKNFSYVGSTKNFKRRGYHHKTLLYSKKHYVKEMIDDVTNNGRECVSIKEIETCDESVCLQRESFWVDHFSKIENIVNKKNPKTQEYFNPDNHPRGMLGKRHSEETKRKYSEQRKGHKHTVLTRERSLYMNSIKRVPTEKRINASRKMGEDMGKPVINNTTGEIFSSIRKAAIFYGVDHDTIKRACNKIKSRRGKIKNFSFSYHTDTRPETLQEFIAPAR